MSNVNLMEEMGCGEMGLINSSDQVSITHAVFEHIKWNPDLLQLTSLL